MSEQKTETETKRARKRSPNFPSVDLQEAIRRAAILYEKSRTHSVSLEALAKYWGYTAKSSSFQKLVAALTSYGLIEVEGASDNRRLCVSKTGERIIEKAPDANKLTKSAALKPKIFGEMWEKYKQRGLPDDDVLRDQLKWDEEHDFNDDALDRFIANFRNTLTYAKLIDSDSMLPEAKGSGWEKEPESQPGFSPPDRGGMTMKDYPIPLGGGVDAVLRVPQPITAKMYEKLKLVIDLYQDVLVSEGQEEEIDQNPPTG